MHLPFQAKKQGADADGRSQAQTPPSSPLSLSLSVSCYLSPMASHHHHQHCHSNNFSSCCCCSSCNSSHPSQFSQAPTTDPLVQALASQLLQSSQTHLYAQYLKPQHQQFHQKHLYQKQQNQHQHTQSLLYSLLRRVDALESSLHQISVSPPPPPSISLRDLAARTIQTHFRAFLVRRSRTLRQLKDLAFIKASLNSLKSSVSDGSQLKPEVLSQKAMDLLLKLDSIQGGDPMIRDGKKSVSRDLVRFLEFVDGLSVKKRELSSKVTKSLRLAENSNKSRVCIRSRDPPMGAYQRDLSGEQRELLEKLSSRSQGISDDNEERHVMLEAFHQISDDEDDPKRSPDNGAILMKRRAFGSKAKKSVSFAQNGNLIRVFEGAHGSFLGGHESGIDERFPDDDQRELVESREVEEIGEFSSVADDNEEEEEAYMERKGLHLVTDGDRNPRFLQREVNYGKRVQRQVQTGESAFSPPLPVQMELRSGTVGGKH
ncbi:hypothetical protein NE237_007733 [Protea cynaroides]|uniref:BAG domain-containing protein n=1 Tax=Protea cynaroides TaxID=273540 RepID=A0A9Q0KQR0_9MAGN|nr:hypothetical protein NE237_007733 [Protea cynaroides]